jgi:hypothetical protein
MESSPGSKKLFGHKRSPTIEEEEGLLSGQSAQGSGTKYDEEPLKGSEGWSRKKMITVATVFIALLITGAFTRTLYYGAGSRKQEAPVHSQWFLGDGNTRSNGTNEFKRTVVIVSIDGLRYGLYIPCSAE